MKGLNTFIDNCTKATGIDNERADNIIQSMVKAINGGALGGTNFMAQMSKIRKNKFTMTNQVSDIVAADTGYEREDVKKVVGWMFEQMVQTINQGGMPALIRMVNLMKKGNRNETEFKDEIKDINTQLKNAEKNESNE